MTKKDYTMLAKILNQFIDQPASENEKAMIEKLCEELKKDNPNFNKQKFVEAIKK